MRIGTGVALGRRAAWARRAAAGGGAGDLASRAPVCAARGAVEPVEHGASATLAASVAATAGIEGRGEAAGDWEGACAGHATHGRRSPTPDPNRRLTTRQQTRLRIHSRRSRAGTTPALRSPAYRQLPPGRCTSRVAASRSRGCGRDRAGTARVRTRFWVAPGAQVRSNSDAGGMVSRKSTVVRQPMTTRARASSRRQRTSAGMTGRSCQAGERPAGSRLARRRRGRIRRAQCTTAISVRRARHEPPSLAGACCRNTVPARRAGADSGSGGSRTRRSGRDRTASMCPMTVL